MPTQESRIEEGSKPPVLLGIDGFFILSQKVTKGEENGAE
jgi:hypothetical protein